MNTIYKIIAKLLANQISEVSLELLSKNQWIFTKGWLIFDNVLLAKELLRGFNQKNTLKRVFLVLDLSKAFDSVSWKSLMKVIEVMQFSRLVRRLVYDCISTTSFSLLIEGEAIDQFGSDERGLHQGDPLSPILFNFIMDHLS